MALSKEANERMWDALLTEALIESSNRELERIKREMEAEGDIGDFSKEITRKIKALISSVGRRENLKSAGKILRKTVIAAAFVISIMSGAMLTQPDVYAAVGGVIRKVFDTHDSYEYIGQSNVSVFNNKMTLGYIPDGYTLRYVYYSDYDVDMMFDNKDNQQIIFDYGLASGSKISVDNEYTELQIINRSGTEYYFYKSLEENEFNTIIWYKNGYVFDIDAQFGFDELIKVAENIRE